MPLQPDAPRVIRFGLFEVDFSTGELRKRGRIIRLQGQPFQVLKLLLIRQGDVVSREEVKAALWRADTFVDFDQGLNTAIKKIRMALGDSADNPRFIETIPRKGYRFMAPVDVNPTPARAPTPAIRRHLVLALACFALIVCAGLAGWSLHTSRTGQAEYLPAPLTSYLGNEWQPSFSPDGNRVAFVWNRTEKLEVDHIFVKLIGADAPIQLTEGMGPAWSPDGRCIAYLRPLPGDRSGVYLIPAPGGAERKVTEVWTPHELEAPYLAWHPAGTWLVVIDKDTADQPYALFLISVKTGERRRLSTPTPGSNDFASNYSGPAVSPDGRAVVFSHARDLFLQELSKDLRPSGQPVRLTFGNRYTATPAWTADGRAIVFSSGTPHSPTLYRIALSGPTWRVAKPERLGFGDGARQPTISRQGRLAFVRFAIRANIWRLRLNNGLPATESPAKLIASTHLDHMPRYSPDGARITFASNRSGSHEIWVSKSDGSGAVQLTSFGGPVTSWPYWSPDGHQILFRSQVQGQPQEFAVNSDGGTPARLTKSMSQDGKWIYLNFPASSGAPWRLPARNAQLSPDGSFLYYPKDGNEFTNLWKDPTAGGEATQVLESVCCLNFTVVPQGIYFIPKPAIGDNGSIKFLSFSTGKATTIAKLSGLAAFGSSVSPDGRWLLYSQYEQSNADLMLVENFH